MNGIEVTNDRLFSRVTTKVPFYLLLLFSSLLVWPQPRPERVDTFILFEFLICSSLFPHYSTLEIKHRRLLIPKVHPSDSIDLASNVHDRFHSVVYVEFELYFDDSRSVRHVKNNIFTSLPMFCPSLIPMGGVSISGQPQTWIHIGDMINSMSLRRSITSHSCRMSQKFLKIQGLLLRIRLWSSCFSIVILKINGSSSYMGNFLELHRIFNRTFWIDPRWIGFSVMIFPRMPFWLKYWPSWISSSL